VDGWVVGFVGVRVVWVVGRWVGVFVCECVCV